VLFFCDYTSIYNTNFISGTTFNPKEKHAVLIVDEMTIKPGLQYDYSIASVWVGQQ